MDDLAGSGVLLCVLLCVLSCVLICGLVCVPFVDKVLFVGAVAVVAGILGVLVIIGDDIVLVTFVEVTGTPPGAVCAIGLVYITVYTEN